LIGLLVALTFADRFSANFWLISPLHKTKAWGFN
jgi:hypothetical protein